MGSVLIFAWITLVGYSIIGAEPPSALWAFDEDLARR